MQKGPVWGLFHARLSSFGEVVLSTRRHCALLPKRSAWIRHLAFREPSGIDAQVWVKHILFASFRKPIEPDLITTGVENRVSEQRAFFPRSLMPFSHANLGKAQEKLSFIIRLRYVRWSLGYQ